MQNAGPAQYTKVLAVCPGGLGDTGKSLKDAYRPFRRVLLSIGHPAVQAEGCKIRASSGMEAGSRLGAGGAHTVQSEE